MCAWLNGAHEPWCGNAYNVETRLSWANWGHSFYGCRSCHSLGPLLSFTGAALVVHWGRSCRSLGPLLSFTGSFYAISLPDFYRYVKSLDRDAKVPTLPGHYKDFPNIHRNADGVMTLYKYVQSVTLFTAQCWDFVEAKLNCMQFNAVWISQCD